MAIANSVVSFTESRQWRIRFSSFLGGVLLLTAVSAQVPDNRLAEWSSRLEKAQKTFDDAGFDRLISEIIPIADEAVQQFEVQYLLSKVYLARCDLRRFKRKTFEVTRKENKDLRKQQEELSIRGMAYADRALALKPNSSEANRVKGEIFIHQITGPISGIRFGPKGKDFIQKAIQLDSQNLEAQRALGLMYLYNPPFNGGDKDKAAETFDRIATSGGDDRSYVLAARAYIQKKDKATAAVRLQEALKVNPTNLEATTLLQQLQDNN